MRNRIYDYFKRISNHEDTHVQTLVDVIKSLGGKPVPASNYDVGITGVGSAVRTAKLLENTGVKAYDGAIAHIEAAQLLTAGATIATVEARHASYLNLINRSVPYPSAFDNAAAPRRICETVREAFIISAPRPYGPYNSLGALCDRLPNRVTRDVYGSIEVPADGAVAPSPKTLTVPIGPLGRTSEDKTSR